MWILGISISRKKLIKLTWHIAGWVAANVNTAQSQTSSILLHNQGTTNKLIHIIFCFSTKMQPKEKQGKKPHLCKLVLITFNINGLIHLYVSLFLQYHTFVQKKKISFNPKFLLHMDTTDKVWRQTVVWRSSVFRLLIAALHVDQATVLQQCYPNNNQHKAASVWSTPETCRFTLVFFFTHASCKLLNQRGNHLQNSGEVGVDWSFRKLWCNNVVHVDLIQTITR